MRSNPSRWEPPQSQGPSMLFTSACFTSSPFTFPERLCYTRGILSTAHPHLTCKHIVANLFHRGERFKSGGPSWLPFLPVLLRSRTCTSTTYPRSCHPLSSNSHHLAVFSVNLLPVPSLSVFERAPGTSSPPLRSSTLFPPLFLPRASRLFVPPCLSTATVHPAFYPSFSFGFRLAIYEAAEQPQASKLRKPYPIPPVDKWSFCVYAGQRVVFLVRWLMLSFIARGIIGEYNIYVSARMDAGRTVLVAINWLVAAMPCNEVSQDNSRFVAAKGGFECCPWYNSSCTYQGYVYLRGSKVRKRAMTLQFLYLLQ